jgi:hypothetical protein
MPSDDAATEPFDAGAWDTDAAADAVLESEASLWPQALRASAAIAAVTAAVAVTGVFMPLSLRYRRASSHGID